MKRAVLLGALVLAGSVLAAQRSAPPARLTLADGGEALAVGDLNGDERPDILVGRLNAVTVYLGDGRGAFARVAGSPFAAGDNPSDLALGDFNEDGRLDIAAANHETSYVSVLTGDGGGLGPPVRVPVPSRPHPHGIAIGDFNADRHLDLAVESWMEDTVLVLHGNGRAAFASEPRRLAVGPRPYHKLRAGDLDADGRADLVTTNTDGSSVSVLCTKQPGALRPARAIGIPRSPFAVAIGDVNGDRVQDLAGPPPLRPVHKDGPTADHCLLPTAYC